jgi:hypothetical protein
MSDSPTPPAWIEIASEEDLRSLFPEDSDVGYDFGFLPAMTRLIASHPRIGPLFGMMYGEIMFNPASVLSRTEAEMVAGVAAAAQDCFY